MKEIVKKYQIIFILCAVVITMAIIKVKYGVVTYGDTNVLITPTVRELPTPTKKMPDPDYPLLNLLPYSGRGFTVDRYTAPLTLAVKIKGLDEKLVRGEINEWFKGLEIATESHKIKFEEFNLDQKSNIKDQNLN